MSLGCSSNISCAVLVPEELVISLRIPSKHVVKSCHYRPSSKTPSERRFAGEPIVARDWILAGHIICRGGPLNSFDVSRATKGVQWLSGRVLDSRPKGRGFEPHRRHCVVSLSKNINPSLVLVQPRKTRPFITERLLMGR